MNELILADKIDKKLQERREPVIFPLAHNHRKELRKLRDENIGNLRDRLNTIKRLKEEEYIKKHKDEIEEGLVGYEKKCVILNKDWDKRASTINKIIKERKKLEKKYNIPNATINHDYGNICNLNISEKQNRTFKFNRDNAINGIAKKQFEDKFGKPFEMVGKKIDDIHTKYEEAINFGDLEIVKQLYYLMKKAEGFFDKIDMLEV